MDEKTMKALGRLGEALETVERARGHLYAFHQLTGRAHLQLEEAAEMLRTAGHGPHADRVAGLGCRDVLPGRWTYQVVEEYDDGYYADFRDAEGAVRRALAGGRRHVYEAEMKRTGGQPS